jgi:hypothetical protein
MGKETTVKGTGKEKVKLSLYLTKYRDRTCD